MNVSKVAENTYRIEPEGGMRVPGLVFVSEQLLHQAGSDEALQQVANVASLPGIVTASMAMPDIHWGYGFPIGGVAAMDAADGVVSPGGVGFDINCGVRLVRTDLRREAVAPEAEHASARAHAPHPAGRQRPRRAARDAQGVAAAGGAGRALAGRARSGDRGRPGAHRGRRRHARRQRRSRHTAGPSSAGTARWAAWAPATTSSSCRWWTRSSTPRRPRAWGAGARPGRGDDPLRLARLWTPDVHRPSAAHGGAPRSGTASSFPTGSSPARRSSSPEGQDYLAAMAAAANFAFCNRQVMMHQVRLGFEQVFGRPWERLGMELVYDVAHNIAKLEEHEVDGKPRKVWVHRKGATRAFGPGRPELSPDLPGDRPAGHQSQATWAARAGFWWARRRRCG